jgi:hypothetical protein
MIQGQFDHSEKMGTNLSIFAIPLRTSCIRLSIPDISFHDLIGKRKGAGDLFLQSPLFFLYQAPIKKVKDPVSRTLYFHFL